MFCLPGYRIIFFHFNNEINKNYVLNKKHEELAWVGLSCYASFGTLLPGCVECNT
jgi:hypothetical protein